MRGAVLHGLGLNLVKERLMRRSYGVTSRPVFVPGRHPENLKYEDVDGTVRCKDVMEWYAIKVYSFQLVLILRAPKCKTEVLSNINSL
jgi:hypothetical protein